MLLKINVYFLIPNYFSLQIPFSLTLRVWDLYLLKGERIMIAMGYTILWIHRRKLMKMQMDELIGMKKAQKILNKFTTKNTGCFEKNHLFS